MLTEESVSGIKDGRLPAHNLQRRVGAPDHRPPEHHHRGHRQRNQDGRHQDAQELDLCEGAPRAQEGPDCSEESSLLITCSY